VALLIGKGEEKRDDHDMVFMQKDSITKERREPERTGRREKNDLNTGGKKDPGVEKGRRQLRADRDHVGIKRC